MAVPSPHTACRIAIGAPNCFDNFMLLFAELHQYGHIGLHPPKLLRYGSDIRADDACIECQNEQPPLAGLQWSWDLRMRTDIMCITPDHKESGKGQAYCSKRTRPWHEQTKAACASKQREVQC